MLHTRRNFALLALSIAAALVAGCGAPAAPPATATSPPPTATAPPTATEAIPEGAYPEIARVSLEEAKAAYDDDSAIFVDVRLKSNYDLAHIPGAFNIFFGDMDERLDELDKQKWIITYCA